MIPRATPAAGPGRPVPVPGRPDWKHLARTPRLRLHAAMILGICDPRPLPSPMPDHEAHWVREHILPAWWREVDDPYPYGFFAWCHCQRGQCWNCLNSRCDLCVHRQEGGPSTGDDRLASVTMPDGSAVAHLVRRDDHRCRWLCICPCPKTGAAPATPPRPPRIKATPPVPAALPAAAGQLDIFSEVA